MSAFASLILFILIAITSMGVVAFANYRVEQTKKIKNRLAKLRVRVEELEDVVLALDQVCETRAIPRVINDEVIDIYQTMIELDNKAPYLSAGLANAKMRSEELSNEVNGRNISRLCGSDAQIARMRAYLKEGINITRKQHSQGKISTVEMQDFISEMEWLHLMVMVISNIAEGHKSYNRQDILTANAFYKKAQTELMSSGHPDERRHKMVKQLADILFGRRKSLDSSLMPEDEFNPENNVSQPAAGQEIPPEIMMDGQSEEALVKMAETLLGQQAKGNAARR